MFFSQKRGKARNHSRYGRSPLLTSKPSSIRNRKRMTISNVSMPSLTTIKRILLGLVLCVITGAGLYIFSFSTYFKIGNIYIQYDELQNENNEILTYFDGLKGKNILLTDTDAITDQIRQDHPEFQQVTVKKVLPGTIQIHFSEFPIIANIEQIIDGKKVIKMLVNSVGMPVYGNTENPNLPYIKIISKTRKSNEIETPIQPSTALSAPAPDATSLVSNPPISPTTDTAEASSPPEGSLQDLVATPAIDPTKPIISAEVLNYILKATSYYEEKFGMKILETQFLIDARELHVKTEKYFSVWLDTQISYERQFLKLKKAMATVDIYSIPLDYIDLRITGTSGEKVIFKRKK